jgi:hypothetical protein
MDTSAEMVAPKLTFGFAKKISQPKVLEKSAIADVSAMKDVEETDYVTEVEGRKGEVHNPADDLRY